MHQQASQLKKSKSLFFKEEESEDGKGEIVQSVEDIRASGMVLMRLREILPKIVHADQMVCASRKYNLCITYN